MGGRIHLPLKVEYNGAFFGNADAGAMHFHFGQLIAHAARTRPLTAGTVIGSGTVSNEDMARGSSCLAEKRMLEKIHDGVIKTPFMKVGDTIKIEMLDRDGANIFGTIEQKVVAYKV
jgi:fumarylacetoacetate (FAA) hydrolase